VSQHEWRRRYLAAMTPEQSGMRNDSAAIATLQLGMSPTGAGATKIEPAMRAATGCTSGYRSAKAATRVEPIAETKLPPSARFVGHLTCSGALERSLTTHSQREPSEKLAPYALQSRVGGIEVRPL
jgi:hypothetical protein